MSSFFRHFKSKVKVNQVGHCLFTQGNWNPTVVMNLNLFNFQHLNFSCDKSRKLFGKKQRKETDILVDIFSPIYNGSFIFKLQLLLKLTQNIIFLTNNFVYNFDIFPHGTPKVKHVKYVPHLNINASLLLCFNIYFIPPWLVTF